MDNNKIFVKLRQIVQAAKQAFRQREFDRTIVFLDSANGYCYLKLVACVVITKERDPACRNNATLGLIASYILTFCNLNHTLRKELYKIVF